VFPVSLNSQAPCVVALRPKRGLILVFVVVHVTPVIIGYLRPVFFPLAMGLTTRFSGSGLTTRSSISVLVLSLWSLYSYTGLDAMNGWILALGRATPLARWFMRDANSFKFGDRRPYFRTMQEVEAVHAVASFTAQLRATFLGNRQVSVRTPISNTHVVCLKGAINSAGLWGDSGYSVSAITARSLRTDSVSQIPLVCVLFPSLQVLAKAVRVQYSTIFNARFSLY